MSFNNKVVLITGASSGIGAATAVYFSALSANLVLVARTETNLARIALYCKKSKGIEPLIVPADLTNDSDVERVLEKTIEHFGKLDVLINNAGVVAMGGIKNTNMKDYDKVMGTNMRAVYLLTMLAVPHLIASKGNIVNLTGITGTKVNAGTMAYNLSKTALEHFTKCTALELAADGVRVNSVSPGLIKSNLFKHVVVSKKRLESIKKTFEENKVKKKDPLGAGKVALLIAYLASDSAKAKNITGSCYPIQGPI